jgi:hypothetical protein
LNKFFQWMNAVHTPHLWSHQAQTSLLYPALSQVSIRYNSTLSSLESKVIISGPFAL